MQLVFIFRQPLEKRSTTTKNLSKVYQVFKQTSEFLLALKNLREVKLSFRNLHASLVKTTPVRLNFIGVSLLENFIHPLFEHR